MGFREVTTMELGYICEDGTAPVLETIKSLDECIDYYWFRKIDDMELKGIGKNLITKKSQRNSSQKNSFYFEIFHLD